MSEIKERRKALGLNRKQLAIHAYVDPPTVQLLELGHPVDPKFVDRVKRTLSALEAGEPVPDWKPKVDQEIADDDEAHKFGGGS